MPKAKSIQDLKDLRKLREESGAAVTQAELDAYKKKKKKKKQSSMRKESGAAVTEKEMKMYK